MWPNFIIIGAGKSGTTTVYEYLRQHPQVFMSSVKETNFFALEGKQVKAVDDSEGQMEHYPWAINNEIDYLNLFSEVKSEKAVGEVSPMYLYNNDAPKNIKKRLPNVKLIAILRQPVERLYSRYMHLARESREPTAHFEDALDKDSIWWQRNDLVTEGFYGTYLERYFQLFDANQIKVYLYDELRQNENDLLKDLFRFINVDPNFAPHTGETFNKSGKIKNRKLDLLIGQNSILVKGINKLSPNLVQKIKASEGLKRTVNRLRNKNLEKAPLSKALKAQMTNAIYKDEILKLQKLINKDLSHWLA
ncbi:MAG: sulfotransferase family protein [Bacteroidia bacterium]